MDKYGLTEKYFSMDQSIEQAKKRIQKARRFFYSRSMHTCQGTDEDGVMFTRGFRQDTEVVTFVDLIDRIEKGIKKKIRKQRYLYDYIRTLPQDEQNYIHRRYIEGECECINERIEDELLDEIQEIEEAVQYLFNDEPEINANATKIKFENDVQNTKDFEDNFQDILVMLGVGK